MLFVSSSASHSSTGGLGAAVNSAVPGGGVAQAPAPRLGSPGLRSRGHSAQTPGCRLPPSLQECPWRRRCRTGARICSARRPHTRSRVCDPATAAPSARSTRRAVQQPWSHGLAHPLRCWRWSWAAAWRWRRQRGERRSTQRVTCGWRHRQPARISRISSHPTTPAAACLPHTCASRPRAHAMLTLAPPVPSHPLARTQPPRRAVQQLHHHVAAGPAAGVHSRPHADAVRVRSCARALAAAEAL